MGLNDSSRSQALSILTRWLETGQFPDRMLTGSGTERAFLMELVYGVMRRWRALEWLATACSERKPAPALLPPLLMGIYQMLYMDGIPDYAAVNDTVQALRQHTRNRGRVSYVNAVLRRVGRERDTLLHRLEEQPLGIRESHPDILIERWRNTYGQDPCAALSRWNNTRPGIVIRPRPGPASVEEYRERLDQAGIQFDPHPYRPDEYLSLGHGTRVETLPGFSTGACTIQDAATSCAIDLLAPQPGERVLDACAAPGGKTALIADRMGGAGHIVACDVHPDRIALLKSTLRRLQLPDVCVITADLSRDSLPPAITEAPFDRILLDVPCSNTGVLRRRPDARWRFSARRLAGTVELQRALLDRAVALLARGGRLVYSTCSLEPEENQDLVTQWLHEHQGLELADSQTLFPPDTQTDGAYAALVIKH